MILREKDCCNDDDFDNDSDGKENDAEEEEEEGQDCDDYYDDDNNVVQEEYDWSDYPLYHTTFEDFDAMKNLLDPEFRYHLAIGRLWALMGIGLADAQVTWSVF